MESTDVWETFFRLSLLSYTTSQGQCREFIPVQCFVILRVSSESTKIKTLQVKQAFLTKCSGFKNTLMNNQLPSNITFGSPSRAAATAYTGDIINITNTWHS